MTTLFDFADPLVLLRRTTASTTRRQHGTVPGTVKHSIIHTWSPDASIHHTVIGACHHPVPAKANAGEFYMVAYVSAPIAWLDSDIRPLFELWSVSFMGPHGKTQALPPALMDMEDVLYDRVYIGFAWLWLDDKTKQPDEVYIKGKLQKFVEEFRRLAEASK